MKCLIPLLLIPRLVAGHVLDLDSQGLLFQGQQTGSSVNDDLLLVGVDLLLDHELVKRDPASPVKTPTSTGSARPAASSSSVPKKKRVHVPLDSVVYYTANVSIGSPPQNFSLVLDTTDGDILVYGNDLDVCSGSPNTWSNCAFDQTFDPSQSETFLQTSNKQYFNSSLLDSDRVNGSYGVDIMEIGGKTLNQATIGLLSNSSSIVPGSLGLGFTGGTVSKFLSTLLDQEMISSPVFSLFLTSGCYNDEDANSFQVSNGAQGSLLLGAVDTSRYNDPLYVIPMVPFSTNSTIDGKTDNMGAYRYPSIPLTGLYVSNQELKANLTSSALNIPVILDSSNIMSYLPYEVIVNIATQLNAAYVEEYRIWVQSCTFRDVQGEINFSFNGAVVSIPISRTLTELYDKETGKPFQINGDDICALMFSSSEDSGYNALGVGVLTSMYLVIDLEQYVVGMAEPVDSINSCTISTPSSSIVSSSSTSSTGTAINTSSLPVTATPNPKRTGSTPRGLTLDADLDSLSSGDGKRINIQTSTAAMKLPSATVMTPTPTERYAQPQRSRDVGAPTRSITSMTLKVQSTEDASDSRSSGGSSTDINTSSNIMTQLRSDNITVISGNLTDLPGATFVPPSLALTAVISPPSSNFTALGVAFPLMAISGAQSAINSVFPFLSQTYGTPPPPPGVTFSFHSATTTVTGGSNPGTLTVLAKASGLRAASCTFLGIFCTLVYVTLCG
ncbi:Yps7p [Sugiyamaella lignohabitans]|uniref:Yps7p n=1 Tax=Sugiyamaella lignohabitans TaxID=796027 RepID=A0A161HFQ1_9ASCO|nr:Yps7p [Sugiyamaella lignohabitans]ANB11421.1 Yps7p [Sugiyamaella lignohabitans]